MESPSRALNSLMDWNLYPCMTGLTTPAIWCLISLYSNQRQPAAKIHDVPVSRQATSGISFQLPANGGRALPLFIIIDFLSLPVDTQGDDMDMGPADILVPVDDIRAGHHTPSFPCIPARWLPAAHQPVYRPGAD